MRNTAWLAAGVLTLGLLVGACSQQDTAATDTAAQAAANPPAAAPAPQTPVADVAPPPAPVVCATCGVVSAVTAVEREGSGTGVGAALGAIVGGVAGNQVGGGSGRQIATVAGAIGGAILGNNIEQNRNTVTYYEITIDMEAGGQQFITVPDAGGIAVGSAVEVQGGNIYLR